MTDPTQQRVSEIAAEVLGRLRADQVIAQLRPHGVTLEKGTIANILTKLRKGDLVWSGILALEHLREGTAERLIPLYPFVTTVGNAPSFVKVVQRINDAMIACPVCRDRDTAGTLDIERFRAAVASASSRRVPSKLRRTSRKWWPAESEQRQVTVVTGVSGLDITRALDKSRDMNPSRAIVRVEDHLIAITDHFLRSFRLFETREDEPPLQRAFQLNAQILKICWRLAFRSAVRGDPTGIVEVDAELANLPTVIAALSAGHDAILVCHAVWYDRVGHGFLFAANIRELAEILGEAPCRKKVVALVDDLYDICARLMRPGHMYQHLRRDGTGLLDALLKVVEWRRLEILLSESVAQAIKTELVIFPMKLPVATFERVVTGQPEDLFYLSYSASYPFKREVSAEEGRKWREFVISLSREITATTDLAIIDATGVDEHRIRIRTRQVRDRWPTAPRGRARVPLLAMDLRPDERAFVNDPFVGRQVRAVDLVPLRSELVDLVQSRGRALARQAAGVILLRPFASTSGALADGMDIVSDQNRRLVEFSRTAPTAVAAMLLPHVHAVVLHPRDDEHRRRLARICDESLRTVDMFPDLFRPLPGAARQRFAERVAALTGADLERWNLLETSTLGGLIATFVDGAARGRVRPDRESRGDAGDRWDQFNRILSLRVRRAFDVTKHPRELDEAGDEDAGVPAFREAAFVTPDSWRATTAKQTARAVANMIAEVKMDAASARSGAS